jgi:hypothetical protein
MKGKPANHYFRECAEWQKWQEEKNLRAQKEATKLQEAKKLQATAKPATPKVSTPNKPKQEEPKPKPKPQPPMNQKIQAS